MANVTNAYGVEIDFDAAVNLMDNDICERLHMELAPCKEQDFFDAYTQEHVKAFGSEWELAKENPTF